MWKIKFEQAMFLNFRIQLCSHHSKWGKRRDDQTTWGGVGPGWRRQLFRYCILLQGQHQWYVTPHCVSTGRNDEKWCQILFVALMDQSQRFILNGNKTINVAKTRIRVDGAWIEYSGSGAMLERINATGPIRESISLWVSVGGQYERAFPCG